MDMYVIRHGESEGNLYSIYDGWYDVKLTEKGKNDALSARAKLEGIEFEKVYASDLSRAMDTCRIALPGWEFETVPLLREIGVGKIGGVPHKEAIAEYGDILLNARKKRDYTFFGGESHAMQKARIAQFMDEITRRGHQDKIAVFAHWGSIYCMLEHVLLGEGRFDEHNILIPNCSVQVFNWNGKRWRLNGWNI